jgi:hypothetical protein
MTAASVLILIRDGRGTNEKDYFSWPFGVPETDLRVNNGLGVTLPISGFVTTGVAQ